MAYLLLAECRVASSQMKEFTAQVQQWEQDALRHPDAPTHHGVYLGSDDPASVLVITEFESRLMAPATPAIIQSSDNPGPSLRREKASSVRAGCRGRPREWPAICEVTRQSLKALEAALLLLSGLEWPEVAP